MGRSGRKNLLHAAFSLKGDRKPGFLHLDSVTVRPLGQLLDQGNQRLPYAEVFLGRSRGSHDINLLAV